MFFMLTLAAPLFGALFYVAALYSALPPRRWALLGTLLGPTIFPLFMAKRRWSLLRARGLDYGLFNA